MRGSGVISAEVELCLFIDDTAIGHALSASAEIVLQQGWSEVGKYGGLGQQRRRWAYLRLQSNPTPRDIMQ